MLDIHCDNSLSQSPKPSQTVKQSNNKMLILPEKFKVDTDERVKIGNSVSCFMTNLHETFNRTKT